MDRGTDENLSRAMKAALSNMDEGVIVFDKNSAVIQVNKAMCRMFGLADDWSDKQRYMDFPGSHKIYDMVDEVLENGKEVFTEGIFDNRQICQVHVSGFHFDDGSLAGAVAVFNDVTDARNFDQMRSEFVANVSHELRTPLTSIKGFVETLLDGAMEDSALCRRFLTIIDSETERLGRLIDDLLTLSSLESGKRMMRMRPVRLVDAVRDVLNVLGMQINDRDLRVEFIYQPDLHYINADEDLINQVLINLLDNAVKYTPVGGQVVIRARNSGSRVTLTVSDTGMGMPREVLSRIFERFYRVDKARSREQGGTGLGLAIVKHIVELHGGEILVDSEPGRGTTFQVNFIAL